MASSIINDLIAESSKSVFMFELIRSNVSQIRDVWSQTCTMNELTWQFRVSKRIKEEFLSDEYLQIYVYCEPPEDSNLWCCFARVKMVLISHENEMDNYSREFERTFASNTQGWGFSDFIKWSEVVDPTRGYILNDTLRVQVYIDADPPQNIDSHFEKERPHHIDNWLALFEENLDVKIVRRISEELKELIGVLQKGQIVANNLNDNLKITLDSSVDAFQAKLDSIDAKLEKSYPDSGLENMLKRCMDLYMNPIRVKIHSIEEKMEKMNVKCSYENGTENEKGGLANIADGEPIQLSILKILTELKNDFNKEHALRHRHHHVSGNRTPNCYPSDPVNGCHRFPESRYAASERCYPNKRPEYGSFANLSSRFKSCGCSEAGSIRSEMKMPGKVNSSCSSIAPSVKYSLRGDDERVESIGISDSSSDVSCSISKFEQSTNFPSETEALQKNMDLMKPFKKKLVLVGVDEDGAEAKTHKVTCLKDLFSLKNRYRTFKILDMNIN